MQALQLNSDAIESLSHRILSSADSKRVDAVYGAEAGSSKLPSPKLDAYLTSPSSYNSGRCPPPLDFATVSAGDVVARSVSNKIIRPLPPIPRTAPPALVTTPNSSPARIRPLPSPPSSDSNSDSSMLTNSPETSCCSTPATSTEDLHYPQSRSPPFLPVLEPLAPSTHHKLPKSPTIELIDLSSPCSPMPPAPQVTKLEKLRPHLGQKIPEDAVYHVALRSAKTKVQVLGKVQESEIRTYVKAAITARKILELPSYDVNEDEDDSEYGGSFESYDAGSEEGEDGKDDVATEDGTQNDYSWVVENGTPFRAVDTQYSCKWVHEKGGSRWDEPDYNQVMKALRAL